MLIPIGLLALGLIILIVGGEIFVKGSASLAKKLNVSGIVIGLTVVAFGTSAPELVVNLFSAFQGAPDIAIGNVIGSNIANVLLVLGVAAMIYPLSVKRGTIWKEIPFSLLAVFILAMLANDIYFGNNGENILTRGDGLVLIAFFAIFAYYTYGLSKVKGEKEKVETYTWPMSIIYIIGGIILLVFGGKIMVDNGIILARMAGMSELLIGLTITAVGTSLPELATSAIAAYRRHVDIAIGNVVGSNIFNILWVLGLTPVVHPLPVGTQINVDIGVAMLTSVLLFSFMFTGKKRYWHTLNRWQGAVFVGLYFLYIGFVLFRG